jgi:hypothetical protein
MVMQQIKVFTAKVQRKDGTVFDMRLSGYRNRDEALQAARGRLVKGQGHKITSCKFSHTEEY